MVLICALSAVLARVIAKGWPAPFVSPKVAVVTMVAPTAQATLVVTV